MEYARFGEKIVQRLDASEEWVDVPLDDRVDAEVTVRVAEEMRVWNREHPGVGVGTEIIRAPRNIEIAARLGLTADELAERLAEPDKNQGTAARIPDSEFDALMAEIGLGAEEARARFKGTFWPDGR